VCALCNGHAAAFVLSRLKIKAAAWRLHSVLDGALMGLCDIAIGSSRAPWALCQRAAVVGVGVCYAFL